MKKIVQQVGSYDREQEDHQIVNLSDDPVVQLERNLYGHHLAGLQREKNENMLLEAGWEKVPAWMAWTSKQNGEDVATLAQQS